MLSILLAIILFILFIKVIILQKKNKELIIEKSYKEKHQIAEIKKNNKSRIEELSIFIPDNYYIKDSNGELLFYNDKFEEVRLSKNINLVNSDQKEVDGELFSYIDLYKIGAEFDVERELNSLPSQIMYKKNKPIETKLLIEGNLAKTGLPLEANESFVHESKEMVRCCEYVKKTTIDKDLRSRLLRKCYPSSSIVPSDFIHLNRPISINSFKIYIEENLFNELRYKAIDNLCKS